MIGKGKRSKEVMTRLSVTMQFTLRQSAAQGTFVQMYQKSEIVCYEDLGAEAIRKLEVKDFPVIVVIDSEGNNLYETAIKEYCTLE